jgi:hypothetical protein
MDEQLDEVDMEGVQVVYLNHLYARLQTETNSGGKNWPMAMLERDDWWIRAIHA